MGRFKKEKGKSADSDELANNESHLSDDIFIKETFDPKAPRTKHVETGNELSDKLHKYFEGKVVRKDLTKKIKEGANVPVYVLEYLLGMYCSSQEEDEIIVGVQNVKQYYADGIFL